MYDLKRLLVLSEIISRYISAFGEYFDVTL